MAFGTFRRCGVFGTRSPFSYSCVAVTELLTGLLPPDFYLYPKLDPSLPDTGIGLSRLFTRTSGRPRVLAGPSGPASAMGGLEPTTASVTLQTKLLAEQCLLSLSLSAALAGPI